MKTLKTALSVILVLCIVLSFGGAAFAENTIPNNGPYDELDTIQSGQQMYINEGNVNTNNGTVWENDGGTVVNNNKGGTVENNNACGTVVNNNKGGTVVNNNVGCTVENNNGTVTNNNGSIALENNGSVVTNNGNVTNNNVSADIFENAGPSEKYPAGGIVQNNNGGQIYINNGTVENNNAGGHIQWNSGTVTTNAGQDGETKAGHIEFNEDGGKVETNYGLIYTNKNGGKVENNNGTVTNNSGTVKTNGEDGEIKDNTGGTVENNYGKVTSKGDSTIINNEMTGEVFIDDEGTGTVTVKTNWGGSVPTGVTPDINYWKVEIETENAQTSGATGFTDHNGENYLEEYHSEGSITVTPESGYTLPLPKLPEYTVTAEGDETSGWKLTFQTLINNISLLFKGVKKDEPQPDPGPTPDPQPDPKPDPKPVAAATNDWSDGYYLFNKAVVKQINNAEDGTTVTVDATGWASFMRMVFEALAEHPTVTLVVKYGNNKELTIPAGADILSAIGDAQDVLFTKLAKLV